MNNEDLRIIMRSKASLIVIETFDEVRALSLLGNMFRYENIPAWSWTATDGLAHLGFGLQLANGERCRKPEEVLQQIKERPQSSAFILCDFHHYLDEPKNLRYLKDIALRETRHKVILLSHQLSLPAELSRYALSVSLSLPDEEEIMAIVREEARTWANENNAERIKTSNITLQKLVENLKGLPHHDVRRLAHGAISDDGVISDADLPELTRRKFELMDMEAVLHFEYSTAHFQQVGGLKALKSWLEDRRHRMLDESSNMTDVPKGVLLFGVQGGGKSLAAKAIAGVWGLPLLRFDMGALFNKYIGETEKNMREALKLADLMSPCVLWMDELEKALASDGSDNGTGKRLLGTLLTWMAERKSRVFIVATSNNISVLPPELMRKGRFDEIFFVDLPDQQTRADIFKIHLKKRDLSPEKFHLGNLALLAEGFTGAEIEQAIVSGIYSVSARKTELDQKMIETAIVKTQPLSVVMAESIAELRAWAADRAVFANG